MFNAYLEGATYEDVCQTVGACSSAQTAKVILTTNEKRSPAPLGANKCTHGPGYWCQSHENAVKCGVRIIIYKYLRSKIRQVIC